MTGTAEGEGLVGGGGGALTCPLQYPCLQKQITLQITKYIEVFSDKPERTTGLQP